MMIDDFSPEQMSFGNAGNWFFMERVLI